MTVLITREYQDCLELSEAIHNLGIDTFVEPMLNVSITAPDLEDYMQYHSFIFTSRNAVRYLMRCNYHDLLEKKCFVIGSSTANVLSHLGFRNIYHADNDINQLLKTLVKDSDTQRALYFRGKSISTDIKKILNEDERFCDEKICYKVNRPKRLSEELIRKVSNNDLKVIIFFSKNTAETFLSLCNQYGIAKSLKRITILTISAKLKSALNSLGDYMVMSFDGNKNHLLELIQSCYYQESLKHE